MSLNEKKDGEDPNRLAVSQNIQDELAHVINTSLTNIAAQVDNLNKHAEGIFGALYKEIDKISCRYNTLQEHVIQLNNSITTKETSKESLKATKPKSSQSASIQTELDYPSNPLPAKICNTRDVSVQTSSLSISIPYYQDYRRVLATSNCQVTENSIIPCYQDDIFIRYRQRNEQDVMVPYCIDNDQGLVILPEISYYFETCGEKFVSGVKEQVQERVRKKDQHVSHPIEPEKGPQITVMGNDINVGQTPPTCTELSHSHMDLSAECSVFTTYPINEISKVLTQAVGKVLTSPLTSPPHPQRKKVRLLRNKDSYVSNGVGKKERKPQAPIKNHSKLEVFVSPSPPALPPPLEPDWLAVLRDSKTECPASKIDSQTQFPSPAFRTPTSTRRCDSLQTSLEVGVQTTGEEFFPCATSPPACYEMIAHNLPKQNNKKGEAPPMCTSPVLLRRTEAKEKVSDLLVHASFLQSPPSLDYPSARPLFSKSPKLSTSKSPRPAVLPKQNNKKEEAPPMCTSPVLLRRTEAKEKVSDLLVHASSAPSPPSLDYPSARPLFSKSPKFSASKSPRPAVLPKQNNKKGKVPPMCTSPVLLRRTEAKDKDSDLLVHASFSQSPPSLDYPSARPLFSKSPKLSASKSPRPAVLPKQNKKGEARPMCTSPVLLRRTEAKDKDSDLLVHASFSQSPPSLDYPSARPLFSESPKLSASKSPRLAVLRKQNNKKGEAPPMCTSPVLLRRTEAKDKDSDLFVHASSAQSLPSLDYPSARPLFSKSPKLSASKSPRPAVLPKQNNKKEAAPPMCTSPVLLQRTEAKDKDSDLLVHASSAQSLPSLDYPSARPLFSESPKLSASKSPRPAVLSTPRSSHQPPTRCIGSDFSKSSNAAVSTHPSLKSYHSPFPLSESFYESSGSSVSSVRCASDYIQARSVSPTHFSERALGFSIPSSGKTYIEQSTGNMVPPSQPSSEKSKQYITLQSVFSFPQSVSSRVPSPQTLSIFQYSADSLSSVPKQPPAYNKDSNILMDSIRKGLLLHKTEEHCILEAQIKISNIDSLS